LFELNAGEIFVTANPTVDTIIGDYQFEISNHLKDYSTISVTKIITVSITACAPALAFTTSD
jgi:hypothetical protein